MELHDLSNFTDEELNNLEKTIITEKDSRIFNRGTIIPKSIVKKLQKRVEELSNKLEAPDIRYAEVKLPFMVTYSTDNGVIISDIQDPDLNDLNLDDQRDEVTFSAIVKNKHNKYQKMLNYLYDRVHIISKHYDVSEKEIWSMIDIDDELN